MGERSLVKRSTTARIDRRLETTRGYFRDVLQYRTQVSHGWVQMFTRFGVSRRLPALVFCGLAGLPAAHPPQVEIKRPNVGDALPPAKGISVRPAQTQRQRSGESTVEEAVPDDMVLIDQPFSLQQTVNRIQKDVTEIKAELSTLSRFLRIHQSVDEPDSSGGQGGNSGNARPNSPP